MSTTVDFEAIERKHPELKVYYDNKRLFYVNVFWLVVGGAAAALGANTAGTVMPLHMAKIGLDSEQISNIMAIRGYLMLPLALFLAQLSDRWQSKRGRRLPFLAASIPFPCGINSLYCNWNVAVSLHKHYVDLSSGIYGFQLCNEREI